MNQRSRSGINLEPRKPKIVWQAFLPGHGAFGNQGRGARLAVLAGNRERLLYNAIRFLLSFFPDSIFSLPGFLASKLILPL
jgi:hypothetical protein